MDWLVVAFCLVILCSFAAWKLSKDKSLKIKFIIWGISLILGIGPFLALLSSYAYARVVGSGQALLIIVYIYPAFLLIGLCLLMFGVLKKETFVK